jgi:hypothetical protein
VNLDSQSWRESRISFMIQYDINSCIIQYTTYSICIYILQECTSTYCTNCVLYVAVWPVQSTRVNSDFLIK